MSQKNVNKFLAGAVTATMVATAVVTPAAAASFKDISNIDANTQKEIERAVDLGYFVDAEQFNPKGNITRGQVAKVMAREIAGVKGSDVAGLKAYVEANNLESKVKPFTDVKNDGGELYYASLIVKDAGAFTMSKLNWNDDITRSQMAKVIVGSFGLEYKADNAKLITDIDNASTKYFIQVLASNDVTQPQAGKFYPVQKVTRQQMASFVVRAHDAASEHATVASVKAINNTTVEVTYKDAVEDVKALNFTIEGLKVESAVVKQTDAKTVVLTTSVQEGNKEYTVKESDAIIGKFTGISAVVPEKINTVVKSQQGVIGKEVTVTAEVTVPAGQSKAGIPVTFNINNTNATNNNKIEVEVKTNAEGVASYTYTRYYGGEDTAVAYATHKSSVQSTAKVYWANGLQLTIKDVTEATTLSNGDKKVYEIFSANNKGGVVFVAFKENIGVTPDKIEKGVHVDGNRSYTLDSQGKVTGFGIQNDHPYKTTYGSEKVIAVPVDQNGKANLVLSGADASVTPVVYEGTFVGTVNTSKADPTNYKASYDALAIQATASTVKFEKMINYGLKLEAQGVANAAIRNADGLGGRDYTITYTKADGKPVAANTPVYVAIPTVGLKGANFNLYDAKENRVNVAPGLSSTDYEVYQLTTDKDGKVTFHVTSDKTESYVQPIAFVNDNNPSTTDFDPKDTQVTSEVTYFVKDVTYSAGLSVNASQLAAGHEDATFKYALVDQNGKTRAANADTEVTFRLQNGENIVTVDGVTVYPHQTTTLTRKLVKGAKEVAITVKAQGPTAVNVYATSSQSGLTFLPTETKTVEFKATSIVVKEGTVNAVNKVAQTVTINGVPYSLADMTYLNQGAKVPTLAAFYDHLTVGKTVSVTKDADGKLVFNVTGISSPTTPGSVTPSVVAAVNASATIPEVKAALQGIVGFSSILDSDQTAIATNVHGTLGTAQTVYSLTQTVSAPLAVATTRAKSAQELKTAITAAQAKHNAAVEGTEVGQYAAGSKATLQTAITTAQGVYDTAVSTSPAPTNTTIDTAKGTLTAAVTTFETGKVVDVRPALLALINEAKALVDANPIAGTKPGQYDTGVITTLNTAVGTAENAYNLIGSTYATYKGALDTLQTALDTAKSKQVKVVSVKVDGTTAAIDLTFSPALNAAVNTFTIPGGQTGATAAVAGMGATTTTVTINVTGTPATNDIITVTAVPVNTSGTITFDLKFNGTVWELVPTDNFVKATN